MASSQVLKGNSTTASSSDRVSPVCIMADNFPSKAFLVIEYCDSNDSAVACWSDDGQKFIVKDMSKFAASHLPRYFKHSNFQSFVRQLNLYGFHTVRQDSKSDGVVVFCHDDFRRGRQDLLTNITRSKKDKTNHKHEKRKENFPSFNNRFDDLQQQMDLMLQKLDLIISLMPAKRSEYPENYPTTLGGKRRRQDDWRAKSPSLTTDAMFVSEVSSQSSDASSHAAASPRYTFNMDVIEESKVYENSSTTSQVDDDHEPQALNDEDPIDTDDFKDFMDMMLDDDQAVQHEYNEQENGSDSSATLLADPLMSKAAPDTVESVQQVTTASAIHTSSGEEEFDEEAGFYEASSPPLTTAVEVTHAVSVPGRQSRRHRTSIYIAIGVVAVLITAIVWPVVVFTKDTNNNGSHLQRPPGNGGNDQGWEGNRTGHDSSESASPARSKRPPATSIFSHAEQDTVDKDVLQLTLNDKAYECHVEL
jgi:hypothetical protein